MGTFKITRPDGSEYNVDADTPEQASKNLDEHLVGERKAASAKEFTDTPWYGKPAMITDDIVRNAGYGLSAGWLDKGIEALTGQPGAETAKTQAAADRLGGLLTPITRGVAAMMLPSRVLPAVTAIRGGPIAKSVVSGAVAGGEGAAYGGAEAASQDENPLQGAITGGVGGILGQTAAGAVRSGVNAGSKAIQGINDVPPIKKVFKLPQKPTGVDRIELATAKAAAAGEKGGPIAAQAAQKQEFNRLLTGINRGAFSPTQVALMEKIKNPSMGESAAGGLGSYLQNKIIGTLAGAGAGYGTGSVPAAVATAGAMHGAGALLRRDAAAATQEAVDNLRRTMTRTKRYMGPLSARQARKGGQGAGYGAYDALNDYLSEND